MDGDGGSSELPEQQQEQVDWVDWAAMVVALLSVGIIFGVALVGWFIIR